ncbi:plasmolipin [Lasioglossum baleicum]|uniref:plasmolipin n=1 Tax=Lasioglossum baleicum TaxID=434251 RepID=UPI003FCECC88
MCRPHVVANDLAGLGIICMACASPARVSATHWFLFVAVTSFIATLLWCFIYFLSIREALKLPINWIMSELLNTSIFAFFYMIAFIAQLSVWSALSGSYTASNIAAGVFGIFNTVAYAAGAYFLYIEWKSSNTQ